MNLDEITNVVKGRLSEKNKLIHINTINARNYLIK